MTHTGSVVKELSFVVWTLWHVQRRDGSTFRGREISTLFSSRSALSFRSDPLRIWHVCLIVSREHCSPCGSVNFLRPFVRCVADLECARMSTPQPRAVLWDMDGVLVDSAAYHFEAWRTALAELESFDLSYAQFKQTFGQRNDTILRTLFGPSYPDASVARVGDRKEQLYRGFVRQRGIQPLTGVRRWLERLQAAGWRQAVASAAPRANVEAILDALDLKAFFDAYTGAEDVTRGKPDPQVYLVAAERLGVPPARAVVVEDAPAGLEGARRAGMKCIGVRSSHSDLQADLVVDSLDALPDDAFDRLIPLTEV